MSLTNDRISISDFDNKTEIQRLQRRSADEMRVMRQTRSGGGDGGDGS